MFERFTEEARRALFFARGKTAERDGDAISSEDLLAGLVMAAPDMMRRFASTDALTPPATVEEFMTRFETTWRAQAGKEIPFSAAANAALERAIQEADDLAHRTVRPEHLLLGLLRDPDTEAGRTLHRGGVKLPEVMRVLAEEPI